MKTVKRKLATTPMKFRPTKIAHHSGCESVKPNLGHRVAEPRST
jgi:hypothetical protein